ncbi:aldehyde dehydrogenase (NADP(+)) [Sinirhodobacter populi]|uniref:Aldehyde dehydrogenase (NADP(+)) n=1 Tax=Paenirhodobacter populi TaxID=2306993 RepID=A0A443KF50_9RHOB|nr:aldehyde dehydrogenase (NADP(+)) [Sinirhodobacter populi]RWR31242.1 aldehyde dehydrogenase (NADP(+)) [Sinirhodobacter populi]
MTYTPHGKSLIAGAWVSTGQTFASRPARGASLSVYTGTADLVHDACEAAEAAFWSYGYSTREERARFLEAIADGIEDRAADITAIATAETGLPEARLNGERGRTTGQLRLFAAHIRKGDYLDRRHDPALPDRQPLPRPDLRMIERPIGPVAVFGASNFPLAFSVAGGDTASALAAGCPVVVKGHEAHPGTGEIVAEAIHEAIKACGLNAGVFSLVQGGSRAVGEALVRHPRIKAVGFTGSLGAGRALFDLCAARPEPIPFFGELGSINPMFLLPEAVSARGDEIGAGWAGSLTMGAGQFCTNPGIAIAVETQADAILGPAKEALVGTPAQIMLTDGMAEAYRQGAEQIVAQQGVEQVYTSRTDDRTARPNLFRVKATDFARNPVLSGEVFGPLGLLVTVVSVEEMLDLAKDLEGQLTATLHMDDGDMELAGRLLPILERKAGRVMANGYPTGVEVCDAMVHGGPWPASTNFGATSVGTLSIRRFLRPVCYQNIPPKILPEDLR